MSANCFDIFKDLVVSGKKEPSRSNLFGIKVFLPTCMLANDAMTRRDQRTLQISNNYLADAVTVPGKRADAIEHPQVVGNKFKLANGQTHQDVGISFVMTKDAQHRLFFEKWMNYAAPDQENRATFYDEYVTNLLVTKWELGSPVKWAGITDSGTPYTQRLNSVTSVWQFFAAWPIDMSQLSFNNGPTQLVKYNVKFAFERYRYDTVGADALGNNTPDRFINSVTGTLDNLGLSQQQRDAAQFGV